MSDPQKITMPKHVFSFRAFDVLPIRSKDGIITAPVKVEMTSYPTKTKIIVTGKVSAAQVRSTPFNIIGYDQYPDAPDWLIDLVCEAGFHAVVIERSCESCPSSPSPS